MNLVDAQVFSSEQVAELLEGSVERKVVNGNGSVSARWLEGRDGNVVVLVEGLTDKSLVLSRIPAYAPSAASRSAEHPPTSSEG